MTKYKIVYQQGINIEVVEIEAATKVQAEYIFYMEYGPNVDLKSIEEVENESDVKS